MDLLGLIGVIVGAFTIEGLGMFFFIKEIKKHKKVENVDAEVAVAQHANELLSSQLERSHETIARKDKQIDEQQKKITSLLAAQSCLFDDMCIHKGCRLRKPHQ